MRYCLKLQYEEKEEWWVLVVMAQYIYLFISWLRSNKECKVLNGYIFFNYINGNYDLIIFASFLVSMVLFGRFCCYFK